MHNETSRDVTFDEDATFIKSKQTYSYEVHDEETVSPRFLEIGPNDGSLEENVLEDHDMEKP